MLRIENSRNNRFFGAAIIWNHVIEIEKKEAGKTMSITDYGLRVHKTIVETNLPVEVDSPIAQLVRALH